MKAQKKPIVIDYIEATNKTVPDGVKAWVESFGDKFEDHFIYADQGPDGAYLKIKTLEGTSYDVTPEHNIIRGVKGEYYPCVRSIFDETYDKVD